LYVLEYVISEVSMAWMEDTADDSLAEILARIKLGMAIAAMIKMMATTTNSSIKENPDCRTLIAAVSMAQNANRYQGAELLCCMRTANSIDEFDLFVSVTA
jgi:hypothetical protein